MIYSATGYIPLIKLLTLLFFIDLIIGKENNITNSYYIGNKPGMIDRLFHMKKPDGNFTVSFYMQVLEMKSFDILKIKFNNGTCVNQILLSIELNNYGKYSLVLSGNLPEKKYILSQTNIDNLLLNTYFHLEIGKYVNVTFTNSSYFAYFSDQGCQTFDPDADTPGSGVLVFGKTRSNQIARQIKGRISNIRVDNNYYPDQEKVTGDIKVEDGSNTSIPLKTPEYVTQSASENITTQSPTQDTIKSYKSVIITIVLIIVFIFIIIGIYFLVKKYRQCKSKSSQSTPAYVVGNRGHLDIEAGDDDNLAVSESLLSGQMSALRSTDDNSSKKKKLLSNTV